MPMAAVPIHHPVTTRAMAAAGPLHPRFAAKTMHTPVTLIHHPATVCTTAAAIPWQCCRRARPMDH